MTKFYRYYRPMKYSEDRATLDTLPRGGVCLRFETLEDRPNTMWFTHARCHETELFSKTTARQIVDQRATLLYERRYDLPLLPAATDPGALLMYVIQMIHCWQPLPEPMFTEYLAKEYEELASTIHGVITQNTLATMKQEAHTLHLAALQYGELYASLAR
jgi:hypothetical protein